METSFKKKLIVVSNREPYCLRKERYEKTVGGLVSALDPVMQAAKGVWIASGTAEEKRLGLLRVQVPPERPAYILRKVPLKRADIEGYYNGYSNRFLWPLCHMALDRVSFANSFWQSYRRVNRLFADAVLEEAWDRDAVAWLQDYHLALCASGIKSRRPDITVSLFWHIPWPPYAVFRICPHRKELLEGLLANDLLGFQLDSFKDNFIWCVEAELDAKVDLKKGRILYSGHTTVLKSFPISMDFDWFEKAASTQEADVFIRKFLRNRRLERVLLGLSVNRLDYTKGLIKCLDIFDLFFEKYASYRGKITFIQVSVPTRKIEPYLSYRDMVKKRALDINRKYGKPEWRPVVFIDGEIPHHELAALYKKSDLAIISSVYDGMNLVAKEYIASQVGLKGALLVSEFAGAAEEVPGVTAINPYDTEGSALAIKKALEAKPEVRKRALLLAREYLRRNNIYKWVDDVLKEIKKIRL